MTAAITLELDRLREIADLAAQVRQAQRQYFKTRDRGNLIASKQLERRLDDALANAEKRCRQIEPPNPTAAALVDIAERSR